MMVSSGKRARVQKCRWVHFVAAIDMGSADAKRRGEAAHGHIKGHHSEARREESRPQALEMDPTFCERSPLTNT